MTTIVASYALRIMAADSRTEDGELKWPSRKIERVGGSLFGCSGDCDHIERFMRWVRSGRPVERKPRGLSDFSALELNDAGLWLWSKSCEPYPPGNDPHAIGSGALAALAAVHMGADPARAVEVACAVASGSDLPVQIERL